MWGVRFLAGASAGWNTRVNIFKIYRMWKKHLVKTWKDAPTEKADTRQSVRRMEKLPNRSRPKQV